LIIRTAWRNAGTVWATAAAPSYLAARPRLRHPRDLARVDCIDFFYPSTGKPRTWEFTHAGVREVHEPNSRLVIGNAEATVDAAAQGMGVVQTLDYLVEPAVREGKLLRLLQAWDAPGRPISVVYPSNRYLSARVRVFAEFVR
jgi:LysR family transcriptional regulator for bpeEF and oprC